MVKARPRVRAISKAGHLLGNLRSRSTMEPWRPNDLDRGDGPSRVAERTYQQKSEANIAKTVVQTGRYNHMSRRFAVRCRLAWKYCFLDPGSKPIHRPAPLWRGSNFKFERRTFCPLFAVHCCSFYLAQYASMHDRAILLCSPVFACHHYFSPERLSG